MNVHERKGIFRNAVALLSRLPEESCPVLILSAQLLSRRLGLQVVGTTCCDVADKVGNGITFADLWCPLRFHISGFTSCTLSIQTGVEEQNRKQVCGYDAGFTSSITGL